MPAELRLAQGIDHTQASQPQRSLETSSKESHDNSVVDYFITLALQVSQSWPSHAVRSTLKRMLHRKLCW